MESGAERREIDGSGAASAPADPGEPTVEQKVRAVLAVLAGSSSSAREASALGVAEADIDHWKRQFVDAGSRGMLAHDRPAPPPPSIAELAARNEALRSALRLAKAEAVSRHRSAKGRRGAFVRIEEIRRRRGMPVERFCALIGVSRRTYYRNLALHSARAGLRSAAEAQPFAGTQDPAPPFLADRDARTG